jgi:uncharacterized membrane protein
MQMRRTQGSSAVRSERAVSLIIGAALLAIGWRRRSLAGAIAGLAGAAFACHGATRGLRSAAARAPGGRACSVTLRETVSYETGEPVEDDGRQQSHEV